MNKHKHAELIKAWADGAEIEIKTISGGWETIDKPTWHEDREYRIKPQPKPWHENIRPQGILCWVWDGEESKNRHIVRVVLSRDGQGRYMTNTSAQWWSNATPLTKEEALNLVWQGEE